MKDSKLKEEPALEQPQIEKAPSSAIVDFEQEIVKLEEQSRPVSFGKNKPENSVKPETSDEKQVKFE